MIINGLLKSDVIMNPAYLFILAGTLTILNVWLTSRNFMYITYVLFNALVIVLLAWLAIFYSGTELLTFSGGGVAAGNSVFFLLTVLWLIIRSIYTGCKRRDFNVTGHFDIFICITFLTLLIAHALDCTIQNGLIWVMVSLFFNLLCLYLNTNSGRAGNPSGALITTVIVLLLVLVSKGSDPLLSGISGTAGFMYDYFEKIFLIIISIFASAIEFFAKLSQKRISFGGNKDTSERIKETISGDIPKEVNVPGWLDTGLKVFTGLLIAAFLIVAAIALYNIVRWLVSKLIIRNKGGSESEIYDPWAWCRELHTWLKSLTGRVWIRKWIKSYMPVLFSGKMTISAAYMQLLRWGEMRKHPRKPCETPAEYSIRLSAVYPGLAGELEKLSSSYVSYRYAKNSMDSGERGKNCMGTNAEEREMAKMLKKIYFYDIWRLKSFIINLTRNANKCRMV
jgi:hypothetical protein